MLMMQDRDLLRNKLLLQYRRRKPLIILKRILEFFTSPIKTIRYIKDKKIVLNSGLFDEDYYLKTNPDLYTTTANLLRHFLVIGYHQWRDPGPGFNIMYYVQTNPELRNMKVNPVIHYLTIGQKNGLLPVPTQGNDVPKKRELYSELIRSHVGKHKIQYKAPGKQILKQVRLIKETGLFDAEYYLSNYPAVKAAGIDAVTHYCIYGWEIGCSVNEKYDFTKYLEIYSDVKAAHLNPLLHYIEKGKSEGRKLFYTKYMYPVKEHTLEKDHDKIKKQIILEYRKSKVHRSRSNTVVYSYNIADDMFLFEAGIRNDWDYICFVDSQDKIKLDSIWEYRLIDYFDRDSERNKFFYKYHPHIYLKEYKYSIWIDPSIIKIGISFDNYNVETNNDASYSVFSTSITDKNIYDDEQIVIVKSEIPNDFKRHLADTRIIIRENENELIQQSNILSWYLYSKYDAIRSYIENSVIVDEGVNIVNLGSSSDLLVSNSSISERELTDVHIDSDYQNSKVLDTQNLESLSKKVTSKVIIPVFNALEYVKQCLISLEVSTPNVDKIIIADDGSEQETADWLRGFAEGKSHVLYIRHDKNVGYTANVNSGVNAFPSDFTVVLNSDTIVSENWLEKLLDCAYSDDAIGIVGPLSNAASWQTVPNERKINALPPGFTISDVNTYIEKQSPEIFPKAGIVNGFCFGVKQEVFDTIGSFDAKTYPRGYGEEDDFCLRAAKAGIQCAIAVNTYVFHAKSKSFGHEQRIKLATASRQILDTKYGKENLFNITESLRDNPILRYYKNYVQELYYTDNEDRTEIGEPVKVLSVDKVSDVSANKNVAVHLHLYYTDMAEYFMGYLRNIPLPFDLYVSVCNDDICESIYEMFSSQENVQTCVVKSVDNRGRDIAPFLITFSNQLLSYDYVLHIHSKKSSHDVKQGEEWLAWMMDSLLYNPCYIANIFSFLESNETVGFATPPVLEKLYPHYSWRNNRKQADALCEQLGLDSAINNGDLFFPAGSFFWCKPEAIKQLFAFSFKIEDFPDEPIAVDGTIAHAIERCFFNIGRHNGYEFTCVRPNMNYDTEDYSAKYYRDYIGFNDVYNRINDAIETNTPFALIRYYDGEGAFYKISQRDSEYVKKRMQYYFGDIDFRIEYVDLIKNDLVESLKHADVIGVVPPEIYENLRQFENNRSENDSKLHNLNKRINNAIDLDGVWRILASYDLVMKNMNKNSVLCSKDIHYELVLSKLIYKLIRKLKKITLITSQPLKEPLQKIFSLNVDVIIVPERAIDSGKRNATGHFPKRYFEIINELGKNLKGNVFLVGAGPLGKKYCCEIKKNGGIALDIGAVMDSWISFGSRPEHYDNGCEALDKRLLLPNIESLYPQYTKDRLIRKNER